MGERHETYPWGEEKTFSPVCLPVTTVGLMYRIVQDPKLGELTQLLLPATLREKIITSLHDDTGHLGLERSLQMIRERCYWPKMYSDIENWIKKCERFTLAKMPNKEQKGHRPKPVKRTSTDSNIATDQEDGADKEVCVNSPDPTL